MAAAVAARVPGPEASKGRRTNRARRSPRGSNLAQMYPDRLGLGVGQHRLEALVPAEAGLLVAAPRLGHVAMIEAVHPDDARLARGGGTSAPDGTSGEADQGRCEDGASWPLFHVPDAEVAVPGDWIRKILRLIDALRPRPYPARSLGPLMDKRRSSDQVAGTTALLPKADLRAATSAYMRRLLSRWIFISVA